MRRGPHQRSAYGTIAWVWAYQAHVGRGGKPIFSAPYGREEAKAFDRHHERAARAVFKALGAEEDWFELLPNRYAVKLQIQKDRDDCGSITAEASLPITPDGDHILSRAEKRAVFAGAFFARGGDCTAAAAALNEGLPGHAARTDFVGKQNIARAAGAFADSYLRSTGAQRFGAAHEFALSFAAAMVLSPSVRDRRAILSLAKAGELLDRHAAALEYLKGDHDLSAAVRAGLARLDASQTNLDRPAPNDHARAAEAAQKRVKKIRLPPRARCLEPA